MSLSPEYNIQLYGAYTVQGFLRQYDLKNLQHDFLIQLKIAHPSRNTARNARSIIQRFLDFLPEHPSSSLEQATAQFVSLFEAPSYRYTVIYYLRYFFDHLSFPKSENPARLLKYPHVNPTAGRKYLDSHEVKKLLVTLNNLNLEGKNLRENAMVLLVLFTGLRSAEVLAARKEDLGQLNGRVLLLVPDSKTHLSRQVVIPQVVMRAIQQFHLKHPRKENPYLFYPLSFKTSPLSYSAFIRAYNLILQIANINRPGLGWHSLRHTFARALEAKSVDIEVLQRLLGHADVATTRLYRALNASDLLRRSSDIENAIHEFIQER